MKQFALFLFIGLLNHTALAQSAALVQDKESLLTGEEHNRIDSLLQAYRNRTGNLIAVYTDTADISAEGFTHSVQLQYGQPATDKHYNFILLMSRKNAFVFASVNQQTVPFVNDGLLTGILESGFASLREKRRAEGITQICIKAIKFLDQLPKNK